MTDRPFLGEDEPFIGGPTAPLTSALTATTAPTREEPDTTGLTKPLAQKPDEPSVVGDLNLEGATLIRVRMPDGTRRFYIEYQAYGVTLRYDVGDRARLRKLGLEPEEFESYQKLRFGEFSNREGLDVGSIDERLGVKETPQQSIREQLRIFGREDIPPWMAQSREAMTIALQGSLEGWSDGRILNELSGTGAFAQAFPGFNQFRQLSQSGATITEALGRYVSARDQIRDSIRAWRGPDAPADDRFIGNMLSQGWDPNQVEQVLIGEAQLRSLGPGALDRINEILEFRGLSQRVSWENLLDSILPGQTKATPFELQEIINDAVRAQFFETQGITLSAELATALGPGVEVGALDAATAARIAQETATQIFRFGHELAAEREGLTRDDLIRAMVNGDQSAAVSSKLAKFARRRSIEQQGFTGAQGFLGERGNLRIAGFGNL